MRIGSAVSVAFFLSASTIKGQCTPGGPANPPAAKRAITGIVMDSAHNVLENATVFIFDDSAHNVLEQSTIRVARPKREVRTNTRGIFQITDLEPGPYRL